MEEPAMPGDLIRMMRALFQPAMPACQAAWQPLSDIYRTPDGWLIKFDLAGVRPEEVSLIIDQSRLTIRGCRRDCCLEEGHQHYLMEIAYSQFERTLALPCNLNEAKIRTEHRDGMLLVRIEKEEEAHE
jgi:HSP20 family protein